MNGKTSQTQRVIQNTGTSYESGYQAGENIATGPVSLLHLLATNKGSAVAYVMLFDSTASPSGAPTYAPIAVPAGQTVQVDFTDSWGSGFFGLVTASGLSFGVSTSASTYVADTSDCWVSIRYTN